MIHFYVSTSAITLRRCVQAHINFLAVYLVSYSKSLCYRKKKVFPTYKGIWAENASFDEVLISKKMVQDHMPDTVLEVLGKVSLIWIIKYRISWKHYQLKIILHIPSPIKIIYYVKLFLIFLCACLHCFIKLLMSGKLHILWENLVSINCALKFSNFLSFPFTTNSNI